MHGSCFPRLHEDVVFLPWIHGSLTPLAGAFKVLPSVKRTCGNWINLRTRRTWTHVHVQHFHLKDAVLDRQDGNVRRAANHVADQHVAFAISFCQIRKQSLRSRWLDNAQHVQTRDGPGILGCLALWIAGIGRNSLHCVVNLDSQIRIWTHKWMEYRVRHSVRTATTSRDYVDDWVPRNCLPSQNRISPEKNTHINAKVAPRSRRELRGKGTHGNAQNGSKIHFRKRQGIGVLLESEVGEGGWGMQSKELGWALRTDIPHQALLRQQPHLVVQREDRQQEDTNTTWKRKKTNKTHSGTRGFMLSTFLLWSPKATPRPPWTDREKKDAMQNVRWLESSRESTPFRRSTQCYYCPQGSGRSAGGSARDWEWMRRWGSGKEWRTQGRRDTLIMWWPWDDAHKWNLSHDVVCNYDDKNLTTGLCAHGITLAFTCWCSCALCGTGKVPGGHVVIGVVLGSRRRNNLYGPVVIGVVLGFTTQTQYQVQSSVLLDFVVHLCTCSQTVLYDRQFHP